VLFDVVPLIGRAVAVGKLGAVKVWLVAVPITEDELFNEDDKALVKVTT